MQAIKERAGARDPVRKVVRAKVGERDPTKAMEKEKGCQAWTSWVKDSGEAKAIGMVMHSGKGEIGDLSRTMKAMDISDP